MKVTLQRLSGAKFEAKNDGGNVAVIDGPEVVGGKGEGIRPMEMVLVGLAGCSAVDVLLVLQKGRFDITDLRIDVDGTRADAVPAVFTDIHMRFTASGSFDHAKLERAVQLSVDKYCSVAKMLAPSVNITWEAVLA